MSLCYSCSHWEKNLKNQTNPNIQKAHQKAVQPRKEGAIIKQHPRRHQMKLIPSMCTGTGIPAAPLDHGWSVGRTAASAQRDREGSEGLPALLFSWSHRKHVCHWRGAPLRGPWGGRTRERWWRDSTNGKSGCPKGVKYAFFYAFEWSSCSTFSILPN